MYASVYNYLINTDIFNQSHVALVEDNQREIEIKKIKESWGVGDRAKHAEVGALMILTLRVLMG